MSFRVRRLRQTGKGVVDYQRTEDPLSDVGGSIVAGGGAVYDVAADELVLTREQVLERVDRGDLKTTDLVFYEGGWVALGVAPPFEDALVPSARREARVRAVKGAVRLLIAAVVLGIFALKLRCV